jgi:dTDP-4-amino-4,6-dideoxygalactose transaminase
MRVPGSRDKLDGTFDYDSKTLSWKMTAVAERILNNIDLDDVVARRRSNFTTLLDALGKNSGVRPLLEALPEGACPLPFPVVVSRGPELVRRFQSSGIAASIWWSQFHPAVPWEEFPDSCFLNEHVVALPIHQDLGRDHMLRMIAELERIRPERLDS